MEDFEQFALQKELIIAPFVERFPKNYPEKRYKTSRAMRFRTVFFWVDQTFIFFCLRKWIVVKK